MKILKIIGGFVLAIILIAACSGTSSEEQDTSAPVETVTVDPAPVEPEVEEPVVEEEPEPSLTVSQQNAVESAESYLDFTNFSRTGLVEQLEFEGFPTGDATFAVDSLNVDWNEQAAGSAKSYLDMGGFSRSGLVEQLEFEGFTHAQAVYGVNQNGL